MSLILFYLLRAFSSTSGLPEVAEYRHAIYVSVIEINYTSTEQVGIMSVKLFTDDLEDAIQNKTGTKPKLSRNCQDNLKILEEYLFEHLKIRVDGSMLRYSIKGCENVDISIWLEFEFASNPAWHIVEITGDHLMELFPTQSNVFSVKYNDQKKMFRLTNSKRTNRIDF